MCDLSPSTTTTLLSGGRFLITDHLTHIWREYSPRGVLLDWGKLSRFTTSLTHALSFSPQDDD